MSLDASLGKSTTAKLGLQHVSDVTEVACYMRLGLKLLFLCCVGFFLQKS